ncbi:hypothetical protein CEXT_652791 [Caerostris extrusa]|uniref:Uncharacterized protein n=1 Tax=Caerostris extrusa TaxID=172846 RepID=A0AAV4M395_CAEEX|nr:hypothetical protein CEXT_652791 [Caerostris extrusa]
MTSEIKQNYFRTINSEILKPFLLLPMKEDTHPMQRKPTDLPSQSETLICPISKLALWEEFPNKCTVNDDAIVKDTPEAPKKILLLAGPGWKGGLNPGKQLFPGLFP